MPQLPNSQANYYAMLNTLVFNQGKKFITPADEVNAINLAALTVASRLGGIYYVKSILSTIDNQTDFILIPNVSRIRYAEILDSTGAVVDFFDVVPYETFKNIQYGSPSTFRFAWFDFALSTLHIEPGVPLLGQTVRLLCWGMPDQLVRGSIVLYDGDITQMNAVCKEAASILRLKTRDTQESTILHNRAMEDAENSALVESMSKRVTKVQVGRHTPLTRMRRY